MVGYERVDPVPTWSTMSRHYSTHLCLYIYIFKHLDLPVEQEQRLGSHERYGWGVTNMMAKHFRRIMHAVGYINPFVRGRGTVTGQLSVELI